MDYCHSWGDLSLTGESPHLQSKHHYPWQAIDYIIFKALCMSRLHNLFNQIGWMKIDTSVDCGEASILERQHTLSVPFSVNIVAHVDMETISTLQALCVYKPQ